MPRVEERKTKKAKICLISNHYPPFNLGGDAVYCYRLANALVNKEYDVSVLFNPSSYLKNVSLDLSQMHNSSMKFFPIPNFKMREIRLASASSTGFEPFSFMSIRQILSRLKPDLIHLQNFSSMGLGPVSCEKRIPKIMTLHDFWILCPRLDLMSGGSKRCDGGGLIKCFVCSFYSRHKFPFLRIQGHWHRAFSSINTLICPSHFLAKKITQSGLGVSVEVLPNFIDLDLFSKYLCASDENDFRRRYKITAQDRVILYVGKLEKMKGVWDLIISFKSLITDCPELKTSKLVIVGEGPEKASLQHFAFKEKMLDKIIFTGKLPQEGVICAYKASEIFVMPSSITENCPLVVLEAMAAGLPIIASYKGGIPELLSNNGVLVDPSNHFDFCQGMQKLMLDDTLRNEMKAASLKRAQLFDAEPHLKRLMKIYSRAI